MGVSTKRRTVVLHSYANDHKNNSWLQCMP